MTPFEQYEITLQQIESAARLLEGLKDAAMETLAKAQKECPHVAVINCDSCFGPYTVCRNCGKVDHDLAMVNLRPLPPRSGRTLQFYGPEPNDEM